MNGRRLMILHKNKTAITLDRDKKIPKNQLPVMSFVPKTICGLPNHLSIHNATL